MVSSGDSSLFCPGWLQGACLGHWQLLPLLFQVHEYLRGEKRCLVGVRSQCLFANRLPLCSYADPLCGSLRGRWIVPLGFASRGLKATTWNRSRNTTPRQLGPQWGRFFRIHPFCVAKYYLRANKMRNLGAPGRRGEMYEPVAQVFCAAYVWLRELLQRTPVLWSRSTLLCISREGVWVRWTALEDARLMQSLCEGGGG